MSQEFHNAELLQLQQTDVELRPIIEFLSSQRLPDDEEIARRVMCEYPSYALIPHPDGALYRLDSTERPIRKVWRLVIPTPLRERVLAAHRDTENGGHSGVNRTFSRLAERYYWPGMFADVTRHIASCHICNVQKAKPLRRLPLACLPPCDAPFDRCHADCLGPFPRTARGNTQIILFVDSLSKWVEGKAVS